ncbi:hypothetical protein R1X06_18250, partial [Acinetobacter baumannii]|uniref:hypothetical protein n=1 Tax=Acinetobacter baumannii TaxID=470 RepID=UPI00298DA18D
SEQRGLKIRVVFLAFQSIKKTKITSPISFYIFSPSSLIFMANNKNLSVTGCNISKISDTKL